MAEPVGFLHHHRRLRPRPRLLLCSSSAPHHHQIATDGLEKIIRSFPHNEVLRPFMQSLLKLSLLALTHDNEDNSLIPIHIIFNLCHWIVRQHSFVPTDKPLFLWLHSIHHPIAASSPGSPACTPSSPACAPSPPHLALLHCLHLHCHPFSSGSPSAASSSRSDSIAAALEDPNHRLTVYRITRPKIVDHGRRHGADPPRSPLAPPTPAAHLQLHHRSGCPRCLCPLAVSSLVHRCPSPARHRYPSPMVTASQAAVAAAMTATVTVTATVAPTQALSVALLLFFLPCWPW